MIDVRTRCAILMIAALLLSACSAEPSGGASSSDNVELASAESRVEQDDGDADAENSRRSATSPRQATAPLSTSSTQLSGSTRVSRYLKAESGFLTRGGLDSHEVERVLTSREAFVNAIDAMSKEASRGVDTQDLSRHIHGVLERAAGEDMKVSRLACGLSVCMGSLESGSAFDEKWSFRYPDDDAFKMYGFFESVEKVGDTYESRFLFSIDQDLPGIVLPNSP